MRLWTICAIAFLTFGFGCASQRRERVSSSDVVRRVEASLAKDTRQLPADPAVLQKYITAIETRASSFFPGAPENEVWFVAHTVQVQDVRMSPRSSGRPVIVEASISGEVTRQHTAWWYQHRTGLVTLRVHTLFDHDQNFLSLRDSGIQEVLGN